MLDIELALMTGVDIPLPEYETVLHQPSVKEISMMGENNFFNAVTSLNVSTKMLNLTGEEVPINFNNFILLCEILKKEPEKKNNLINFFTIIFPQYNLCITPRSFLFNSEGHSFIIDEGNFEYLQNILKKVFCLQQIGKDNFNPNGAKATEIAKKLERARQRVAAQKRAEQGETSLAQYISVLTVAIGSMSLKDCIDLTLYQLYDLLERYNMYLSWDIDIRSRLAGAKADKPLESWMKPLH